MSATYPNPSPPDRLTVVRQLQHLTEQLSAPDLTAEEASRIRPRLLRLLDTIDPLAETSTARVHAVDFSVGRILDRCAVA